MIAQQWVGDVVAPLTAARADTHAPPGAVFAVAEGEHTHIAAAGIANLHTGEAMTAAHAFDLASVTKLLTILALRRVIADGSLTEETTARQVLGARAGAAADATIDELLRHRAGLWEWWPLYLIPDAADDPIATALALPPRYKLGAGRHYSDLGMLALGGIVTHLAGAALPDAIRALVLEPLGITTLTAGAPLTDAPVAAGQDGDAIEYEMVQSGTPYPVGLSTTGFSWRTHTLCGEVSDGNAYHACGGAAGHAGYFGDTAGLLQLAAALADPAAYGFGTRTASAFATALDAGQGQGVVHFLAPWRGGERLFIGHGGFTGTLLAAAPATETEPAVLTVLLSNRLHGRPAPHYKRFTPVETLWREAMANANSLLHPATMGAKS